MTAADKLLPTDERIISIVEEIVTKGAKPCGNNGIDWDIPFIGDIICQALNQRPTTPSPTAADAEVPGEVVHEMQIILTKLRILDKHREWFADSNDGLRSNITCGELLKSLEGLAARLGWKLKMER